MMNTQEQPEVINTSSSDDSSNANLSPEETQQIAHRSSGLIPEEDNERPILEDQHLLVQKRKIVSEDNPLFRIFTALMITSVLAIAVLFVWSFWSKITGENHLNQKKQQQNLVTHQQPQENSEDRYKTELALINQDSDLKPEPEPKSEPKPEPTPRPAPRSRPVSTREPKLINPLDQWATLSQLGTTTGDSLTKSLDTAPSFQGGERVTAQSNLQDLQQKFNVSSSSVPKVSNSNEIDSSKPFAENLDNRINHEEVAKISSVSLGSLPQTKTEREFTHLSPQVKDLVSQRPDNSFLLRKKEQWMQQDDSIASQLNHLSNLGTSSSFASTTVNQNSSNPDRSRSYSNNKIDDYLEPNREKNVPLGAVASGKLSTTIIWSDSLDPDKTTATINLSEPLVADDGSVALRANSKIICSVESIADNGLTILNALAIDYKDSQGQSQQQPLPPDAILIRGESNEPLIAETVSTRSGTVLGQDVLTGLLGAGERGFELLNQQGNRTVVSDDGFFRSSVNPSFIKGAAEGIFSSAKKRLEEHSDEVINQAISRTKIYQIEAGTPISIYVNSFLPINN